MTLPDPNLSRRRVASTSVSDGMPENTRTPKNWNLITGSMEAPYDSSGEVHVIPKFLKPHRITLLFRYVSRDDRESTGSQPTRYKTRQDYKDVACLAVMGGVSSSMQNEQAAENQAATFYVDVDPRAAVEDGVLFANNLYSIEAVEPVGEFPAVAWEIHATRKLFDPKKIEELQRDILAVDNETLERQYAEGN